MRKLSPAWFLFLFAPVAAEYLSGSSPIANPIILLVNMVLYGCGVLLIRELKVRWQTGWSAVFVLSIAYTIAEEGLMLNTLFDPLKNTTGRFAGVNWVWTVGMVMVHSLVSILPPILVAEAVHSDKVGEPWLKPKAFWMVLGLYMADVFGIGSLLVKNDRPTWVVYAIEFALIAACLLVARKLSAHHQPSTIQRSPRWFYCAFLIGTIIVMAAGFGAPALHVPTMVQIGIMLGAYGGFLWFAHRNQAFDIALPAMSKLACASGIISFWILVSPFSCALRGTVAPLVVAMLMPVFLFSLRKQLVRRV